jgi:hypothetical protein
MALLMTRVPGNDRFMEEGMEAHFDQQDGDFTPSERFVLLAIRLLALPFVVGGLLLWVLVFGLVVSLCSLRSLHNSLACIMSPSVARSAQRSLKSSAGSLEAL